MSNVRFEDLNLSKALLTAVSTMGFEIATPIQARAIPEILAGKDIIGQAATGTGKTAAFGLPGIDAIDEAIKAVQLIVLCPTRELAIQVSAEMSKFLKHKKNIVSLPIYGGQPIERQLYGLRKNPRIVVGTPGRILDHLRRGSLKLDKIKVAVLDEADEMLDMGFREDIQSILENTSDSRQTVLFSATMSSEVLGLTRRFQKNPEIIKIEGKTLSADNIEQFYFDVESSRKTKLLAQLITEHNPKLAIVFCNTKRKVDEVSTDLRNHGFFSAALHGDIRQRKRDTIMGKFRAGKINILVATDVAARGIDVSDIGIIFNYGIPRERESYVHRIGRTGRAGKSGMAMSLVSRSEFGRLRDIMRYTNYKIERSDNRNLPDLNFVATDSYPERDEPRRPRERERREAPRRNNSSSSRDGRWDGPRRDRESSRYSASPNNARPSRGRVSNAQTSFGNPEKVIGKITNQIKRTNNDDSSKYTEMMKNLLAENNSLENVTAALLKMVVEGQNR
jgi:ATP-dependent RNA helicase DeaD